MNKSGRHLQTGRAIELLEEPRVKTAQGWVKVPEIFFVSTDLQSLAFSLVARTSTPVRVVNGRKISGNKTTTTAGTLICQRPVLSILNDLTEYILPLDKPRSCCSA